jgi:alpha-ribazole phosphatase
MIDWRVPFGCSRLVLVRHAEPDESMRGRCYGQLDVGLSTKGEAQASRLVSVLRSAPIEAVYASPRRRAIETIKGLGRAITVMEGLREINFGLFEGMTYEEAEARYPDTYRCWMERPTEVAFPGGEAYSDVRARVRAAAAQIRMAHPLACSLLVAHGGTLRTVLAEALRMSDVDIFRLDIDHASVSVIDTFGDGTPIVRLVNGRSALDL